jgi:hypothetical protein
MNRKLDSVFHSVEECKESGHPCKMSKKNIDYIYKPDKGIKDTSILKTLFSGKIQPKLSDCVIIYNKDRLAIVEIKCGTVTKRLVNETFEKIENVFKILKHKDLNPTKILLVYSKYDDSKLRQYVQGKSFFGLRIIDKKYENNALEI